MSKTVAAPIYFDNAATTPLLPSAFSRLNELTQSIYGNSSSMHRMGRLSQEVLEESQEVLGRYFDVPPSHIVFTSGGTESNNLAIWGALGGLTQAVQWIKSGAQGKIITSTVEHAATTKVFEALECLGADVGWIGVDQEGLLDCNQLEGELSDRTRLISFHHAQNEIGVVQDLAAISRLVREKQPDTVIHTDAIQSFLKVPVQLSNLGVDLLSISGHKIGAPKGIGAVIIGRRFEHRVPKIGPLLLGSSQQNGMRPGTVPIPLIGSLVAAIQDGKKHFEENQKRFFELREKLVSVLPERAVVNGPKDTSASNPKRAPQTLSFSIPGLPAAVAVEALSAKGFCVSSGSACHSASPKPNETLMQMGAGRERALSAIRVSFNPSNTVAEIDAFAKALHDVIEQFAS